jgi:hypothetical protein
MPDAVAVADRAPAGHPDPTLVVAFHDNKKSRSGHFTGEDQGKLFVYCVLVLEFYQHERPFMPCSLFDGRFAQCFRVVRSREPTGHPFYADRTRVLDLSLADDAQLYAAFMTDRANSGYSLAKLHPKAVEVLGRGGTSLVFSHADDPNCVIKVPYNTSNLAHERTILDEMGGVAGMIKRHEDDAPDESCLLLTPRLKPLKHRLHLARFVTLIDEHGHLRLLHGKGLVHCDVRPPNIMAASTECRAALVDFGAVRRAGVTAPYDHGTLSYASDRVLHAYEHNTPIAMAASDDMASFARCVIAVYHNLCEDDRLHTRDVHQIRACWRDITTVSRFARELTMLCSRSPPDYDAVCRFLGAEILGDLTE